MFPRLACLLFALAVGSIAHGAAVWTDRVSVTAELNGGTIKVYLQEDTGPDWRPDGATIIRFRAVFTGGIPGTPPPPGAISVIQSKTGTTWDMSYAGGTGGPGVTGPEYHYHTLSGSPNPDRMVTMTARLYGFSGFPYAGTHHVLQQTTWDPLVTVTPTPEASTGTPGPRVNSDLMAAHNPYNAPMTVKYTDKLTGEVLMEKTLQPGEELLFKLQKGTNNDVVETFTLEDYANFSALDGDGNPQFFSYGPGYTWNGADIPHSSFEETKPEWQPPTTRPISPPPEDAVHDPDATPSTVPSKPTSTTQVAGKAGNVGYSTATGTGGATDASVREGTGAVVQKLSDIEAAIKAQGSGGSSSPITAEVDLDPVVDKLDDVVTEMQRSRPGGATVDLSGLTAEGAATSAGAALGTMQTTLGGLGMAGDGSGNGGGNHFNTIGNTMGTVSGPSGGGSVSLGNLQVASIGLNTSFDADERLPTLRAGLNYAREAFLWGLAYLFMRGISASVARYQVAITQTPQTLTLEEPTQLALPGVGWAKQAALSLAVIAVIAAHLAALIVVSNTKLGEITGSWTIANISNVAGVLTGGGGGGSSRAFAIVDMFFPVLASVQFGVSWIGLTFLQMGAFALASAIVKGARV